MHPTHRTLRATRPVTGRVVRASCSALEHWWRTKSSARHAPNQVLSPQRTTPTVAAFLPTRTLAQPLHTMQWHQEHAHTNARHDARTRNHVNRSGHPAAVTRRVAGKRPHALTFLDLCHRPRLRSQQAVTTLSLSAHHHRPRLRSQQAVTTLSLMPTTIGPAFAATPRPARSGHHALSMPTTIGPAFAANRLSPRSLCAHHHRHGPAFAHHASVMHHRPRIPPGFTTLSLCPPPSAPPSQPTGCHHALSMPTTIGPAPPSQPTPRSRRPRFTVTTTTLSLCPPPSAPPSQPTPRSRRPRSTVINKCPATALCRRSTAFSTTTTTTTTTGCHQVPRDRTLSMLDRVLDHHHHDYHHRLSPSTPRPHSVDARPRSRPPPPRLPPQAVTKHSATALCRHSTAFSTTTTVGTQTHPVGT